ncbi:MAG: glutathione S-transferase family protein [Candidatus Thiodiazotropha sp.]
MSNPLLIIGNKNYSSWSLRPWIFMRHHQLQFDEKRVALFTQNTNSELSEYHSDYKVPILKDRDRVIWDSLAILEYLSERYLNNRGWPSSMDVRAVARSVSSEMHSSFHNVRNELPMNCRKRFQNIPLSDEAKREVDRIGWLWEKCRTDYGTGGDWLFGEFTIADAMFVPVALRFYGYNIALDHIQAQYVETVMAHPDIREWIQAGMQESEIIPADEITT